ncbi:hypothetical protein TEA_020659 [Camellia sinensis var. sinensis]|uniref:CBS domain-containing protein n=1 Tax=Camellia sinensis var. sinensis TaxID=542762 RepID=A0A4S4DER0_CAMSN|nr:hypothetical protein TEA_020659 [Camellia sinensis var. sinensis]
MDLRQVEAIVKESKGGIIKKKETLTCNDLLDGGGKGGNKKKPNANAVDSSNALQLFLDHIPISSIPGINNSSTVLQLKTKYCLGDAIRLLYEKNVFGAPIVDDLHTDMDRDPDTTSHKLLDHYIGFVDFARMLLWSLENAVIQLLLQSSGLEQFDSIADKALFENGDRAVLVYEDQSITETMHVLWENQIGVVAAVQRETKRLIGCVRNGDLHLLLDNNDVFNNIK